MQRCMYTRIIDSQFDGIGTPVGYAERAVAIGMDALALTDHGTLSGHREWDRRCGR